MIFGRIYYIQFFNESKIIQMVCTCDVIYFKMYCEIEILRIFVTVVG